MSKEYLTTSAHQTKALGKALAKTLLAKRPRKGATVIGLTGDLGGGKTTFLQGFAKGLGVKDKILSPTFIIIRRRGNFYHLDCYRLKNPQELLSLNFKEIITDPKNVVAVEWADRVRKIMPKDAIWLDFDFVAKNKRKITLKDGK